MPDPVLVLPTDVSRQILLLAIPSHPIPCRIEAPRLYLSINKQWKRFARSVPELWVACHLEFQPKPHKCHCPHTVQYNVAHMKQWFRRSQELPLYITLSGCVQDLWAIKAVWDYAQRIQRLDIRTFSDIREWGEPEYWDERSVFALTATLPNIALPILEHLTIRGSWIAPATWPSISHLLRLCPNLRELRFLEVHLGPDDEDWLGWRERQESRIAVPGEGEEEELTKIGLPHLRCLEVMDPDAGNRAQLIRYVQDWIQAPVVSAFTDLKSLLAAHRISVSVPFLGSPIVVKD
ncbi:hypothetical protein FB45DRAFT_1133679 [Roridomyces roridus]|uniref:F-box domain-containing protein n=1 Tax=Roridomyces roridus TaxID=1738132 RepID=A0AAD7C4T3_9AGAR|nr:hypothetical protein FB45DRAFT_1133679 [Roridomyces roridus]